MFSKVIERLVKLLGFRRAERQQLKERDKKKTVEVLVTNY